MKFQRKNILLPLILVSGFTFAQNSFEDKYVAIINTFNVSILKWSEWINVGNHYDCEEWLPNKNDIDFGVSFEQKRNCSQDQERTRGEDKETRTILEEEKQNEIGTKVSHLNISINRTNSILIDENKTIWVTGNNGNGSFGVPDISTTSSWTKTNISNVEKVQAGVERSYYIKSGELYASGKNSNGELGTGDFSNKSSFEKISFSESVNIVDVKSGSDFTMVLDQNGYVWSTGSNYRGQLGQGLTPSSMTKENIFSKTIKDESEPTVFAGQIEKIFVGQESAFALDKSGNLWGVGRNEYHTLALDTSTYGENINKWVKIPKPSGMSNISKVSLGQGSYAALLDDNGNVWTVGMASYGFHGTGASGYIEYQTWTKMNSISNVKDLVVIFDSPSLWALKDNGELDVIGRNNYYQTGVTDSSSHVLTWKTLSTDVEKIIDSNVFFKNDDKYYVAGSDNQGKLGVDPDNNGFYGIPVTEIVFSND